MAIVNLIVPDGFEPPKGEIEFMATPRPGDTVLLNTQSGRETFCGESIVHGMASDQQTMKCLVVLRKANYATPDALAFRCVGSS